MYKRADAMQYVKEPGEEANGRAIANELAILYENLRRNNPQMSAAEIAMILKNSVDEKYLNVPMPMGGNVGTFLSSLWNRDFRSPVNMIAARQSADPFHQYRTHSSRVWAKDLNKDALDQEYLFHTMNALGRNLPMISGGIGRGVNEVKTGVKTEDVDSGKDYTPDVIPTYPGTKERADWDRSRNLHHLGYVSGAGLGLLGNVAELPVVGGVFGLAGKGVSAAGKGLGLVGKGAAQFAPVASGAAGKAAASNALRYAKQKIGGAALWGAFEVPGVVGHYRGSKGDRFLGQAMTVDKDRELTPSEYVGMVNYDRNPVTGGKLPNSEPYASVVNRYNRTYGPAFTDQWRNDRWYANMARAYEQNKAKLVALTTQMNQDAADLDIAEGKKPGAVPSRDMMPRRVGGDLGYTHNPYEDIKRDYEKNYSANMKEVGRLRNLVSQQKNMLAGYREGKRLPSLERMKQEK